MPTKIKGRRLVPQPNYRQRKPYRARARPSPAYRHTVKLRNFVTTNSTAGGVLAGYFNDDPSACYDWASLTSLYDLYRVESLKVRYFPHFPNDTSTTTGMYPMYICFDADNTTSTPATRQEVMEYENMKVKNLYLPWSVKKDVPRVAGNSTGVHTDLEGFVDIGGARAFSSFRYYADGLDISTDYGDFVIELVVTFKNRR